MRYYIKGRAKGYIAILEDEVGRFKVKTKSLQEAMRNAVILLYKHKNAKFVSIFRYWDEDDLEWDMKLSGYVSRDGRGYRYINTTSNESYYIDKNGKRI